jgi:glutathione S-transferase
MRLHYSPFSSNSRRARLAAAQLGADVELVLVDLAKGEQRSPAFLHLNPSGRVPVLEDGDFVLPESQAIMQYLADSTPGQTLYPTALRERAEVNRWMFWCAHHFQPAISVFNWEHAVKAFLGLGAADPAELQRGERLFGDCARVLDAHLAEREWICGSALSLADLSVAAPLMYIAQARLPVEPYAHMRAWFDRVQGLEAWANTAT